MYIGIQSGPRRPAAEIGKDVARWLDQNFFRPAK
jgi:hypothetical protein